MNYQDLPVYQQKERILETLRDNQVIVVQSPTGSGKTTQIPVILHEAGYDEKGMIAVTQPRRIAALSVSEFISKQLGTTYPGLVGYKMRFEDKTDQSTKIKIMTDGILLQEMKLDPWLSKYSVIMVDEAHERSLNIDFVLGLLKRVLKSRSDFRVIVSSATMNAEAFSRYFDDCPIVTIETVTYPVTMVYDPPKGPAVTTLTDSGCDLLLKKISDTVERVLDNKDDGGILIFLPGEKIIKDCVHTLSHAPFGRKLFILPLYGRLAKEEQERVFIDPPAGKKKVVISTNIAETSVTISDISTVIDSGLAKLNYYNPHTYTSSLIETTISKASSNQRRGRAGRTHEGTCYRLYTRKDFDTRPMYTTEEIYRTDLSEVVLRMAELGITDFFGFDFISSPDHEGIVGAIETLKLLGALEEDNTLSTIGQMMCRFPLEPRISRIIVEAIMRYPDNIGHALIGASFLSASSPFLLPEGEEMEARKAHHHFRDIHGDFVSYINLFKLYKKQENFDSWKEIQNAKERFCKNYYLDERVMAEIDNINDQLSEIVNRMEIPVTMNGSLQDYLCCVAAGMIQFVCIRSGRENYKSLTQGNICIHPGSVMFKQDPLYIVAGEITKTSRMFAFAVSPLTKALLDKINPNLASDLDSVKKGKDVAVSIEGFKNGKEYSPEKEARRLEKKQAKVLKDNNIDKEDALFLDSEIFATKKIKGKKTALLEIEKLIRAANSENDEKKLKIAGAMTAKVILRDGGSLLEGEKLSLILNLTKALDLNPIREDGWNRKANINLYDGDENSKRQILTAVSVLMRVALAKQKTKEYGFITLFTDGNGNYWQKSTRGFSTALNESLGSLETLVEENNIQWTDEEKEVISKAIGKLNTLYK
ncbi:MAG: ATP-dependent RNA helicase [Treponema sp.]|nr:ATP-dependent RNA helicase [Treponema sp.]